MDTQININTPRFERELLQQGMIGWIPEVGLCRESYSKTFFEARDWLRVLMENAELETRVDRVGNLFGRWTGKQPQRGIFLTGSHLDSVMGGGVLDGALGIFSALEAIRSLRESGYEPQKTIEIAAFNAEEGGSLGGTFGSRAFCGLLRETDIPLQILQNYGLTYQDIAASAQNSDAYTGFLELHIEQGPCLSHANLNIGIPTAIVSITRYQVTLAGEANHAGTTPFAQRRDALLLAAKIIDRWFDYASSQKKLSSNIGTIAVFPAQVAVIPEKCTFCLEMRSIYEKQTKQAFTEFKRIVNTIALGKYQIEKKADKKPVHLNADMGGQIAEICKDLDLTYQFMPSGASHDAASLAKVMPSAMIFVPSTDGISHSLKETTPLPDLINGTKLLAEALKKFSK